MLTSLVLIPLEVYGGLILLLITIIIVTEMVKRWHGARKSSSFIKELQTIDKELSEVFQAEQNKAAGKRWLGEALFWDNVLNMFIEAQRILDDADRQRCQVCGGMVCQGH